MDYFFELQLTLNQSLNYFELDSEEATHCDHCHLICCVYINGHVEMVDTKDQSNAIVLYIEYGILFVDTVDTKIKARKALNAIHVDTVNTRQGSLCFKCYLCRHCRYKTSPDIPAHNFLNIQWIFNPQKVWESWDSELFNHIIDTIYVNTVDSRQGSLMHSMLSMSTLSIQNTSHTVPAHNCLNIQWIFNLQKVLKS